MQRGTARTGRHLMAALIGILWTAPGAAQRPPVNVHPEMKRLDFLLGDWEVTGKTVNPKGEVIATWTGRLHTCADLGGQLVRSTNLSDDGTVGQRNWKFFNKAAGKLKDVNFDLAGNFEVRRATGDGGDLVFTMPEPFVGRDGVARDWRKTYTNVTPDSYDLLHHYSRDGREWTLAFIVHHRRSAPGSGRPRNPRSDCRSEWAGPS